MHPHSHVSTFRAIRSGHLWAGNRRLKIYGTLRCGSGKRMHSQHRVFFRSEQEAQQAGYRPCGHCMKHAYQDWKNGVI